MRTSPQSVLVRDMGPDINQPANQTTQPGMEPTQIGVTEMPLKILLYPLLEPDSSCLIALSVTNKRRMIDMRTNTLDIEVRPHRDGAKTLTMDANTQASLSIVDVMLPSDGGDQLAIPQINLSTSGYEPNSSRDSHIRSPSMRAQEISIMPQLDGPASLPREIILEEEYKMTPV